MTRYRLAVVAPHVVQYHAPLYRELARRPEVDALVLYLDRTGSQPTYDATMGATIDWDVPLLEGYRHQFLFNTRIKGVPGPSSFFVQSYFRWRFS